MFLYFYVTFRCMCVCKYLAYTVVIAAPRTIVSNSLGSIPSLRAR